jgi:hypothetical protein
MKEALNKKALMRYLSMRMREFDRAIADDVEGENYDYISGKWHEYTLLYEMIEDGDFDLFID